MNAISGEAERLEKTPNPVDSLRRQMEMMRGELQVTREACFMAYGALKAVAPTTAGPQTFTSLMDVVSRLESVLFPPEPPQNDQA